MHPRAAWGDLGSGWVMRHLLDFCNFKWPPCKSAVILKVRVLCKWKINLIFLKDKEGNYVKYVYKIQVKIMVIMTAWFQCEWSEWNGCQP